MPVFEYKALSADSKREKGLMEGDSERQVRQALRDKGLTPLSLKAVDKAATDKNGEHQAWLKRKISTADLSLITRQLATLLQAGMPLTQSLQSVAVQAESRMMQRFLTSVHSQVAQGYSLAQALAQTPFSVGQDYMATIHAGEESGHLEAVLSRLADTIEQQERLRKKVQGALIYPMMMVVVAIAIVFFLMAYVVPKVVTVFDNMSQTLPPLTQGMLTVSDFVQNQTWLILFSLLALVLGFKWLMRFEKWKFRWHNLLLNTPLLKKFLIYNAVAKWSRTLGVLVASGVPVKTALHISSQVMTHLPLRQRVLELEESVRKGQALSQAMKDSRVFPPLLLNLVQTGENSGQLDEMLLKGASHYEYQVETSAATLVSLLEPLLIITMGGVVLMIVLAIMLPIFEMNQMLG
ncbi:MAG: type II secretion system inner membrane protein GspF [Thiomicrospira sp.]|uniref:type II secretion system inner membrane protein GspF n=1 Tax=Thiomicrospira sp. TaxID=935 RepID=UPI0019F82A35|nr:type II secretion system inner membrane protein GspF [Thiomicrospira sp.]MBE0494041.1 type II secretion system inner membrane protein GspF [Thiomicrospira sp.]